MKLRRDHLVLHLLNKIEIENSLDNDHLPSELKSPHMSPKGIISGNFQRKVRYSSVNKSHHLSLNKQLEYFNNSKDIINNIMM